MALDTEDVFALMNIIKIAENDIEKGNVRKADDVFKELRKRLTGYTDKKINEITLTITYTLLLPKLFPPL